MVRCIKQRLSNSVHEKLSSTELKKGGPYKESVLFILSKWLTIMMIVVVIIRIITITKIMMVIIIIKIIVITIMIIIIIIIIVIITIIAIIIKTILVPQEVHRSRHGCLKLWFKCQSLNFKIKYVSRKNVIFL